MKSGQGEIYLQDDKSDTVISFVYAIPLHLYFGFEERLGTVYGFSEEFEIVFTFPIYFVHFMSSIMQTKWAKHFFYKKVAQYKGEKANSRTDITLSYSFKGRNEKKNEKE